MKTKFSSKYNLENEIICKINNAEYAIAIICFEVSSKAIINLLKQKSKEGISVSIICEERKAGVDLMTWHSEQENNVKIKFSNPNNSYHSLHEKLILVDDTLAIG